MTDEADDKPKQPDDGTPEQPSAEAASDDAAEETAADETSAAEPAADESDAAGGPNAAGETTPDEPPPTGPRHDEAGEAAAGDDAAAVDAVAGGTASARGRRWGLDGPVGRVLAVVGALSIALVVVLAAMWIVRSAFDDGDRGAEHHGNTMRRATDAGHRKASGGAKGGTRVLWGDKPSDHAGRTVVIIHSGPFTHPGMKQFGANGGLKPQVGGWPKSWAPDGWSRSNPFGGGFMAPNFMPFDGTNPFGRDWLPPAAPNVRDWIFENGPGAPRADRDPWGKGDWGSLEDLWNSERWKNEAPRGNLEDLLGKDAPRLGLPDADGALQLELAEFCAQLQSGELFEDLEGLDDADESSLGLLLFGSMFLDGIFEDLCTQPTPDPDAETSDNNN